MRWIRNIGLGLVLMVAVNACFTPPNYPITPQIEFINEELGFYKNPAGFDTLKIALKFTDGDGDIGLDDSFTDPKYAPQYFFFRNSSGQFILSTLNQSNVNYKFKRLNPSFKLPDFVTPFNCNSWVLKKVNNVVVDTIYTELNPNHYNLFIDYYIKNNSGTFTKYDVDQIFIFPFCGDRSLNGARIPNLSKDPGKESPLDGKIKYAIKSIGLEANFSIKTIKLKISIQDRALNRSNEVESKEFTLQSIRKGG
jgi:hypothetical protein